VLSLDSPSASKKVRKVRGVTLVGRQASNDLFWRRRRANRSPFAPQYSHSGADGERAGVEASRWKPPVAMALTHNWTAPVQEMPLAHLLVSDNSAHSVVHI
jgi:hypothetical protein